MASTLIGLDIGSFAVRAAELQVDARGGRELKRFAQVTLPPGAVVAGEVVDRAAVVHALRRLWQEGGFGSRRVVLGISGQRVIVRQADIAKMSDAELQSAIHYEAQELIPMPIDSVFLDCQISEPSVGPSEDSLPTMRILLAAAQRDVVNASIAACRDASLEPVAVDVVALALLRAVPPLPPAEDGRQPVEAVVSIGADLTVVAIREGATTRFVRVLTTGGSDLTDAVARELAIEADQAEDLKRRALGGDEGRTVAVIERARDVLGDSIYPLVSEIRGSIDFYRAQNRVGALSRVLVTGGSTKTSEIIERLTDALGDIVAPVDPYQWLTSKGGGLSGSELRRAAPYLVTPVGLALWGAPGERRISLLPAGIDDARKQRQGILAGMCVVLAAGAALGGLGFHRHSQVQQAQNQVAAAQAQVDSLQRQVATLRTGLAVQQEVKSRAGLAAGALATDVNWTRLVGQVAAVMPADVSLTSFTSTGQPAASSPTGTPTGPISPAGDTISVSATAASPASVSAWIRALDTIPGLTDVWVSNVSSGTGAHGVAQVNFSSTATLTAKAASGRAAQYQAGNP